MSELIDHIKKIDWKNGIVSRGEALRFINRFTKVILQKAIENKFKKKS